MDWKFAGVIFDTVPRAEMGDKTKLATVLFASNRDGSKAFVLTGGRFGAFACHRLGGVGR